MHCEITDHDQCKVTHHTVMLVATTGAAAAASDGTNFIVVN